MTPPLTGFFMRIAGLGDVHEEIERQKRVEGRGGKIGPRERNLLVSHIGQPYKTWSPSRQVREDQRIANEPTPPSRETARRTNSPTPFPRVHRKNLSRNTLAEYDLTWDWDDNAKNYIVIKEHLTLHELDKLLQHTKWLRERKEMNLALRGLKKEVEQAKKLRESLKRSDAGWESGRGRECDAERASARDNHRYHDEKHAHLPQTGIHIHINQFQNSQPPPPQEALTAQTIPELPSPSHHTSQSSTAPGMHSRLTRPWSPHGYTPMERCHQCSRQTQRSPSRSRTSQAPTELSATSSRRARESYEARSTPPSTRQGSRPLEGAPTTRTASRQWKHIPTPPNHVHFASPPSSQRLASRERLRQAADKAGQFTSQYTGGPRQSRLERNSYSANPN